MECFDLLYILLPDFFMLEKFSFLIPLTCLFRRASALNLDLYLNKYVTAT